MIDNEKKLDSVVRFETELFAATNQFYQDLRSLNEQYGRTVFSNFNYNPVFASLLLEQQYEQLARQLNSCKSNAAFTKELDLNIAKAKWKTAFKADKSVLDQLMLQADAKLQNIEIEIFAYIAEFARQLNTLTITSTDTMGDILIDQSDKITREMLNLAEARGQTQTMNNLLFTGNVIAVDARKQLFKLSKEFTMTGDQFLQDAVIDLNAK